MIAKVRTCKYDELLPKVEKLLQHQNEDEFTIVADMKDIVEEYKSQNSVFEVIDNQEKKPL